MTIVEAYKLRDEYLNKLVGRFYDLNRPDWTIKDVIVGNKENVEEIYNKMFNENISNEKALGSFSIGENDFDTLIIAHPWPAKPGDIEFESVAKYITANSNSTV